jgi:hypothetical protein
MARPSPADNSFPVAIASNFDGEVVATARAIGRVLKSEHRDWHDLAATLVPANPTDRSDFESDDWRRVARYCAERQDQLASREIDFIINLAAWRGPLTDKQLMWLRAIAARLRRAE